jgi:DNA-binding transcriptional regulator YbjK
MTGRRRRYDPDRAERIAEAALTVVARDGVERLTHRAVAVEADVPLGSTTYHYADRDDLLLAALERAVEQERRNLDAWAARLGEEPDLPRALTDLVLTAESERERALVGYEVYVAALRHPRLRDPSIAWTRLLPEHLKRHIDATLAEALAVAVEALVLHALIDVKPAQRDTIEAILRRVAAG